MRHDENHSRVGLLVAAAGIVLLATACGGGPPPTASGNATTGSSSPATTSSGSPQSQLAFASCMRSHGVTDFPDSGPPEQPGSGSDLDPDNPTYQAARRACQSLRPVVRPNPAQAAQSLADALKFAQCMRQHGITNYPDPGPHNGPGGGSGIDLRGIDLNSPRFQAAQQACRQYQSPTGKG